MNKRLFIYLSFFTILIILNLFLVIKISHYFEKRNNIEKVLREITETKNGDHQFATSYNSNSSEGYWTEVGIADGRVANLKAFFRKYNSPLYDYANLIVQVSDQYQFDYRLLPAIAMQESTLCRYIPEGSHNCWGWGIYGDLVTKFDSYEEAIKTVAKGIKKNYIDKGLVTASTIMKVYTPQSKGSWAYGVNTFLKMLE